MRTWRLVERAVVKAVSWAGIADKVFEQGCIETANHCSAGEELWVSSSTGGAGFTKASEKLQGMSFQVWKA